MMPLLSQYLYVRPAKLVIRWSGDSKNNGNEKVFDCLAVVGNMVTCYTRQSTVCHLLLANPEGEPAMRRASTAAEHDVS